LREQYEKPCKHDIGNALTDEALDQMEAFDV
jgi:hypothetical protein